MRRIISATAVLTVLAALTAVLASPAATPQQRRLLLPDLVVSSAAEPPDFVRRGTSFLVQYTVDNQGQRRAGRVTTSRIYLSIDRFLRRDDRGRRLGDALVGRLGPGRSLSRRRVVNVPRNFLEGEYYVIVCVDVANRLAERFERGNCHPSGQKVRVGDQPPTGAAGPPGPAGPAGPGDARTITIPRRVLDLGAPTIEGPETRPGDDEGSTQQADLLEVGGVRIRALCRTTSNGDNEVPGTDADGDGHLGVDNDFDTDEDGDEAKLLLYLDRPDGNFSFSGPHGKRFNIGAGFGNTTTSIEDPADDTGGEGKHQALATAADPETRVVGDADDTDATVGADSTQPLFEPEDDWEHAFRNGSIYVATSHGSEFILNAYVGVGVLGTRADQCTFGGSVTVVNG